MSYPVFVNPHDSRSASQDEVDLERGFPTLKGKKGRHTIHLEWWLAALPLLLFLVLPVFALLTRSSLQQLISTALEPQVLSAIRISLKTTLISLLIIVLFGTPVAFILGRGEFRGKKLIETIVDLPTVLPPSVAGVALLLALGRRGLVGGFLADLGLQIPFSQLAVILAQLFIAAPYFIRSAVIGFAAVDDEILEAGALDGASQMQLFRYIIMPVSQKSLITGAVMSWARALGEFGATIIFAGNFIGVTQTMPLAIYLGFETNLELAITLSVILVLISFVTLFIVRLFTDQK